MSDKQQGGTFTTISPTPPPRDPILRKQFVSHPLLLDIYLPTATLPIVQLSPHLLLITPFRAPRPVPPSPYIPPLSHTLFDALS
jgi:hypothetical protein